MARSRKAVAPEGRDALIAMLQLAEKEEAKAQADKRILQQQIRKLDEQAQIASIAERALNSISKEAEKHGVALQSVMAELNRRYMQLDLFFERDGFEF